jgi:hypothetical protein
MNMQRKLFLIALILLLSSTSAFARSKKDYFSSPQAGIWFGPITPVNIPVDAGIGGGLFYRHTMPWKYLKVGFDTSFQYYDSKTVNNLILVPFYASALFLLPINLPVKIQLKTGFGGNLAYAEPDSEFQVYPMFTAGFEVSFPAGRLVNIGLRVDYLLVIESHLTNGVNGHFFNIGLSVYLNLSEF